MLRRGIKGAEAMEKFERLEGERKKKEVELVSVLASFSGWPELSPLNNLNWKVLMSGFSAIIGKNSSEVAGHL